LLNVASHYRIRRWHGVFEIPRSANNSIEVLTEFDSRPKYPEMKVTVSRRTVCEANKIAVSRHPMRSFVPRPTIPITLIRFCDRRRKMRCPSVSCRRSGSLGAPTVALEAQAGCPCEHRDDPNSLITSRTDHKFGQTPHLPWPDEATGRQSP
jgi:hypothetical protein